MELRKENSLPSSTRPTSSRKRYGSTSSSSEPKRFEKFPCRGEQDSANVIFSLSEDNWSSAEYMLVDCNKYEIDIYNNCKYKLKMSQYFFNIAHGDDVTMLPCQRLCDHLEHFSGMLRGKPHSFQCSVAKPSILPNIMIRMKRYILYQQWFLNLMQSMNIM